MLNCKETAQLLSQEQDRPLALGERLGLRMHLALCRGCRNFRRQMAFLRTACGRHADNDELTPRSRTVASRPS